MTANGLWSEELAAVGKFSTSQAARKTYGRKRKEGEKEEKKGREEEKGRKGKRGEEGGEN